VSETGLAGRALRLVAAGVACALPFVWLGASNAFAAPMPAASLALSIDRGATVAIRSVPAGRTLARAGWKTPFGSVRRLRVVERRGDWFAVESDVLGNGVVGWVPKTAPVRLRTVRFSVEADLSERLVTVRVDGQVVVRRRVSIGASDSPTPSGRFHVTDRFSGRRWGLGCCIVALSGTQPRLPSGWNGGDRLAFHGRPSGAGPIGAPTSAGCLHATEATLRVLAALPLGTLVVIHP
jgi:lipoprotein-anchoring transpeptidase ErfK/SrfK